MQLHAHTECKHVVACCSCIYYLFCIYIIFANNPKEYNNLLNYFCLETRNSGKKPHMITFTYTQENLSTEAIWQLTDLKKNNGKLVYAYQEHKRCILSHTYTPTYADTSIQLCFEVLIRFKWKVIEENCVV